MKTAAFKLAITLLLIAACSNPDNSETPPHTNDPYFKADIKDVYVQGPDDTGFNFIVDTNMEDGEWSVMGNDDWINITRNGKEVIIVPDNIEHDQSSYPAPRSCFVSVKAGTLFEKTFTVVQEAWTRISSEYQVKLKAAGETVEVCVEHNCYGWTPQTEATWLTVRKKDSATLVITSSPRDVSDGKPRTAVVRLQSDSQTDVFWNITVSDADSDLENEDYDYGNHSDWD